ncbi:MAG: ATP-grasp domain-containing protein [Verrucomicrobiaceae bacterium]
MSKPKKILLIGRRKAAIAAAKRCGWHPVVIDVHPRKEQAPNAFGGTKIEALEEALALFPDDPPCAVAAVTTGSVIAAAAIRQHFGLPGLSLETARKCHDKLVMKKAIVAAGLPCAPWTETDANTQPDDLIDQLGLPLVLKMPISSGGRGVWICHSKEEVKNHLRPGLLVEGFVHGTEMSVETFRQHGQATFQNFTRYWKPRWANVVPATLDTNLADSVRHLTNRVHDQLGITTGMTHMELFLSKNGPVFGEIAARPPGGYIMELIRRAYHFDPWEALLRLATGETPPFPTKAQQHAGVWIIHPGHGTVREIQGLDQARAIPGITDLACSLKVGSVFDHRTGSGESKGYLIAERPTAESCGEALTQAIAQVRIIMDHH